MKTAFWLYFFLFIAFFDLHAQSPILTPFALSLGAGPTFIGWMMGIYALTHLPGNLIAGRGVDKHGSRRYMVFSLISAGVVLLLQAHVTSPWQLLALRSISGFVLAFLSPACLALLASLSDDPVRRGKLMSGHGVVHTIASVVSPAVGAFLVAKAGYTLTFQSLGWILIITGAMSFFSMRIETQTQASLTSTTHPLLPEEKLRDLLPLRFYLLPLAVSFSQGILFFELPLQVKGESSILNIGLYFSVISAGALVTLSMLFLNRFSPYIRVIVGMLGMALSFFSIAAPWSLPLMVSLVMMGMAKGVVFPALASLFIELSNGKRLGTVFSLESIALSLGSFIGPIAAGQLRQSFSPYFMAFVILMLVIISAHPKHNQRDTISTTLNEFPKAL